MTQGGWGNFARGHFFQFEYNLNMLTQMVNFAPPPFQTPPPFLKRFTPPGESVFPPIIVWKGGNQGERGYSCLKSNTLCTSLLNSSSYFHCDVQERSQLKGTVWTMCLLFSQVRSRNPLCPQKVELSGPLEGTKELLRNLKSN